MELWFSEYQTKNVKLCTRVTELLFKTRSKYQEISVLETEDFGRVLALDDVIQLTLMDEFIYHEMIAHVPILTHGDVKKVLVIGGGDGGTIREIIKHPVEEIHHVEIDEQVVETSKRFFPSVSSGYSDPRVRLFIEDGIEFVKNNKGYDVVIIDSTDPFGAAEGLFSREFYQSVFDALNDDGIMVAQTESPFFYKDLIKRIHTDLSSIYRYATVYTTVIPTYPAAFWTFSIGSKSIDPLSKDPVEIEDLDAKYYSRKIHKNSFDLPPFLAKELEV